MQPTIESAFRFPAAIIIQGDLRHFRDPANIAYHLGVQQPRQHRPFARFFQYGATLMMYFKHDIAEIGKHYELAPNILMPSEIAPKYWSKILVHEAEQLSQQLLEKSYNLVCASLAKQGRKLVEEFGDWPNRFLDFHLNCMEISMKNGIYLNYRDYQEPSLDVGIHSVARFSWNSLHVRLPTGMEIATSEDGDWVRMGPDEIEDWPGAMRFAVGHSI